MDDPLWSQLLTPFVLMAVNAFFAASEIAVISLNENKVRRDAERGDKKAIILSRMLEKPEGFLSTIQICITLAGFLSSAFAADAFASRLASWMVAQGVELSLGTLNTICVIVITLILSFLTLIFGELVPKRVAMKRPDKVARMVCGVLRVTGTIFKPIVWLLSVCTNGVLRLLRIDPNEEDDAVTEEEIRMMVDIGEEKGAIEANEKELIENIFEFNNTTAREAMTHRTDMSAIWIEDPPHEIINLIEETGLSRFPVYDEDIDNIIGILSTRDYLLNLRRSRPLPLRELLRPAYFVPETVLTNILFRDMQKKKVHMAIVVDEYGGTSGLITMEDLIEEIVGDIYDEFDPQDELDIEKLDDNLWRVAGYIDLETLGEALEMEIPESEDYDTLGGLVFSQLNNIPEDGTHPNVTVCGLNIQVEELEDQRVEWALVSKVQPESSAEDLEE